jgi:hypothetical protein
MQSFALFLMKLMTSQLIFVNKNIFVLECFIIIIIIVIIIIIIVIGLFMPLILRH